MKRIFATAFLISTGFAFGVVTPVQAASLGGSWTGTGIIRTITGDAEKARCRVSYSKVSESSYQLNAKCASTSGKAIQTATVRPIGKNLYSGTFHNTEYNASGKVTITLSGNRQTVSMTSNQGSATLTLRRK